MRSWIEDDDDKPEGPVRMIPMDLAYVGLGLASRLTEAVLEAIDDLQHIVGGHINYLRDREDFAATAGREIETLTSPQEDS